MKHIEVLTCGDHYKAPEQPPSLNIQVIARMPANKDGVAMVISLSEGGDLVLQRAHMGSALLMADGKPRATLLDTVIMPLQVLTGRVLKAVSVADDEAPADPGCALEKLH